MKQIFDKQLYQFKRNFFYYYPGTRPRKILFDHLPKCAGSSFHQYLTPFYPQRKIYTVNGSNPLNSISEFKRLSENQRHSYSLIKGHFADELIEYISPHALRITILRNPTERVISLYHFIKSKSRHHLHQLIQDERMSLADFAVSGLPGTSNWMTSHFSNLDDADVTDNPEYALMEALKRLKSYHIVGTLSDLDLFSSVLAYAARLRYVFDGRVANKTELSNHPVDADIELVSNSNKLDRRLYNEVKRLIDAGYYSCNDISCR